MFKNNKYTNLYFKIIQIAKHRTIDSNSEKHHIIPKSLGGTDNQNNIVNLTYREHFICHHLLTKMVDGPDRKKMCWALHTFFHFNKHRKLNFSARQYEFHKIVLKEQLKKYHKPTYKLDVFKFHHIETGENFIGTRREFILHSGLTEQEANFLFNDARFSDKPMKHIKKWGIWVEDLQIWSYQKPRPKRYYEIQKCEMCGIKTTPGNYARWHGDRCRKKKL